MTLRQKTLVLIAIQLAFVSRGFGFMTESKEFYRATLEACSHPGASADVLKARGRRFGREWDRLNSGHFPSHKFNQLMAKAVSETTIEAAFNFKYSEEVALLYNAVRSNEFLRALRTCYPNDPESQTAFRKLVQRRDRAGKFAGAATFAGSFPVIGLVFKGGVFTVGVFSKRAALALEALGHKLQWPLLGLGIAVPVYISASEKAEYEERCQKLEVQSNEDCLMKTLGVDQNRDAPVEVFNQTDFVRGLYGASIQLLQKQIDAIHAQTNGSVAPEQRKQIEELERQIAIYREAMAKEVQRVESDTIND